MPEEDEEQLKDIDAATKPKDSKDDFEVGLLDNLVLVNLNGKWGITDNKGKVIVKPKYSDIGQYFAGNAIEVRLNGKWGFINAKGKKIVPLIYDSVMPFLDEVTAVRKGNRWGFIDKKGNEITEFKYQTCLLYTSDAADEL